MNDGAGGNGSKSGTIFRLERLYDAVGEEVDRLDQLFDGEDVERFNERCSYLMNDVKKIVALSKGDLNAGLVIRPVADGEENTISVRARYYRFFFAKPSPQSEWHDFVYFREL
ncbi:MAG: hypothetical protein AAGM21_10130 [Pseudomonadota bacterium]